MQFTTISLAVLGLLSFGLVSTARALALAPNAPWALRVRQDGGGYYGQPSDDDGSYPLPSGYPAPSGTAGYPAPSGTAGYPAPSGTAGYPSATGTGGYAMPTVTSYPSPSDDDSEDGYSYRSFKPRI